MRICKTCKQSKPLSQFERTDKFREWYRKECKACRLGERTEIRKVSKGSSPEDIRRAVEWNKNNPERRKKIALDHYYRLRHQAIEAYGGYKCACCGQTEPLFLTIDHIENDGAKHRASLGDWRGAKMFRWLRDNGYPKGFQVLCMNCNHGKMRNNGVCPHQEGVTTIPKGSSPKRGEAQRA